MQRLAPCLRACSLSLLSPASALARQQRFAGHAKWQNIAHTKAANDKKRGQKTNKHCMQIRRAAALGSPDPKINDKLRDAIAAALKANVPRATIDRQLEKAKNVTLRKEIIEILVPGGAFLLVDLETDNTSRTRHEMKRVLKNLKGSCFMKEGAARMSFEEKGVITIARKDRNGKEIDKDRIEEIAIEAGAEEVIDEEEEAGREPTSQEGAGQLDQGDQEERAWTLQTGSKEVFVVKGKLDKIPDIVVLDAEVRFMPIVRVPLSPEQASGVSTLIEGLQAMDEVNTIYDNIKAE